MLDPWEALWSPYDETTYDAVLASIQADDVVLEIGAGDLRLARRIAAVAQRVWAWEIQPGLLARALAAGPLPANLAAICIDARRAPVPPGVTQAVLLMRHCTHYALYVARLREAGCRRLITNARWRVGVESIDLAPGLALESALPGWYTCRRCGSVGFKAETVEQVDDITLSRLADVEGCPACGGDAR